MPGLRRTRRVQTHVLLRLRHGSRICGEHRGFFLFRAYKGLLLRMSSAAVCCDGPVKRCRVDNLSGCNLSKSCDLPINIDALLR